MAERTYPIQNVYTREIKHVPLSQYKPYMTARHASGGHVYEALSDVPGIVAGESLQQTMIPANRVHEAAAEMGKLRLLQSDNDPVAELARKDAVEKSKKKIAEDRNFSSVGIESFASGITFGKYSEWVNAIAGEGAGEARALQNAARPWADFTGKAASMVALGLIPIPGLGAVSVGARTGLRSGSLFEASAQAARWTGRSIKGEGFLAEAGRRLGRPLVFSATAEGPLSFALARADLVDSNKPYTGETLVANALSQWGLSMMIGGAMSIPIGVGMAAIPAAKSGGKVASSVMRGGFRNLARKFLRGKGYGAGDALETETYRQISKITSKASTDGARTKFGRWLGGPNMDEAVNIRMTYQEALDGTLTATTAKGLRRHSQALINSVPDVEKIPGLQYIHDNAEKIVSGRQKLATFRADAGRMGNAIGKVVYRHPAGLTIKSENEVGKLLSEAVGITGSKKTLSGDWMKRLDQTLNIRKSVEPGNRAAMDERIIKAIPDMEKWLQKMDAFEHTGKELIEWSKKPIGEVSDFYDILGPVHGSAEPANKKSLRAVFGRANGTMRELAYDGNMVVNEQHFTKGDKPLFTRKKEGFYSNVDTKFDNLKPELDALFKYQKAMEGVKADASPLMPAKKPMSTKDILEAQVESVMTTKQRIHEALAYVAMRGGGARTTATFGGVMAFRHAASTQEKQALFSVLHDGISAVTATPAALQEFIGELVEPAATSDMAIAVNLAVTETSAIDYLSKVLPRSSDRAISPEHYGMAEIENFLEAVGAVTEPISVLATAADGSTTEQAVDALRTVYPQLYTEMVIDTAEFVDNYGDALGHAQLLGLDVFTGYALGYSDGPAPWLTMQPPYAQTAGQASAIGGPENRRMSYQQNTTPAQKVAGL